MTGNFDDLKGALFISSVASKNVIDLSNAFNGNVVIRIMELPFLKLAIEIDYALVLCECAFQAQNKKKKLVM